MYSNVSIRHACTIHLHLSHIYKQIFMLVLVEGGTIGIQMDFIWLCRFQQKETFESMECISQLIQNQSSIRIVLFK